MPCAIVSSISRSSAWRSVFPASVSVAMNCSKAASTWLPAISSSSISIGSLVTRSARMIGPASTQSPAGSAF